MTYSIKVDDTNFIVFTVNDEVVYVGRNMSKVLAIIKDWYDNGGQAPEFKHY